MDWRESVMCQDVRRTPIGLTEKEAECLTAIHDITAAQGFPPNTTEVSAYLNVHRSSAYQRIANLRRKGYVEKPNGRKSRQTRLTDKAKALFKEG